MKKGQITLDLLIAIFLGLFILTWIESYNTMQYQEAQRQGISQETASIAISEGSIMNAFYAIQPDGDHAELPGYRATDFLDETTTNKQTIDDYLEVNTRYEDQEFQYRYPFYTTPEEEIDYHERCEEPEEIKDDPCIR